MKLPSVLFALLVLMGVVMLVAIGMGEGAHRGPVKHATYDTMTQAPDGLARHGRLMPLGWAFGLAQILVFATCIAFAVRRKAAGDPFRWALVVGGVLHAGAFCGMMVAYQRSIHGDASELVLGFPAATAWMLFGMGSAPLFFLVLYFVLFDRWVMTPEDERRFRELVEAKRNRDAV